ncbi:hypothetical protein RA086_03915 [Lactiplantibacillus sp. WILCCON 0030]|uniref:Uncharacterized protein n=1 Tax=Lactiplantibacillus brownii TaxID=3069269 RepID=A0ABU1A769_9LACO|nr:hypothetical protein [Lactiplantibacillus brownii]MDQ7936792.1 hypothetical protein [Lactiplantibacillus brownii]
MQVVGQFIATVGWLGLALIVSELGATLIYELGQWVSFRLIGARVVQIAGFRYHLTKRDGHWRFSHPLTSRPHLVAMPPADAHRFNHAVYCFGGGLFSLITVVLSLVTLGQFKLSFNLWLLAFIIWIWMNTLKIGQLLPMNLHGQPTAAKDFQLARESDAAMTAAYVTAVATALNAQTGSVADLDASMIVMPRGGGNQNYFVVRQAYLTLTWGLQHGLSTPDLLAGLARLEPSFNTLPPADLAKYLDATIYWNLVANRTERQITGWYQDTGVQQLLQRYEPLAYYKLQAAYNWRVAKQPALALTQIKQGLKFAKRSRDVTEQQWLRALKVMIEAS